MTHLCHVAKSRKRLHRTGARIIKADMSISSDPHAVSLADLGWSAFFADQVGEEETGLLPARIATVHRSRIGAETALGQMRLALPPPMKTTDFAVGDWVLLGVGDATVVRRLDRRTLLLRRTEGARAQQLIAANVDTLFIVTSCNDDFNPARLERYLALSNEAGTRPVIVLTKADKVMDAAFYQVEAAALQRDLAAVSLNAKSVEASAILSPWCGAGQTVALVGSSGVGKSTLLNTLTRKSDADAQATGGIREGDAKGRHTTTARSLHPIAGGGLVIDTPGMRTLHVSDVADGLDIVFAEITELAPRCRFRDCTHAHEPGCAVQSAISDGTLDPARLDRWRKLSDENRDNTPVVTGARGNKSTRSRRR